MRGVDLFIYTRTCSSDGLGETAEEMDKKAKLFVKRIAERLSRDKPAADLKYKSIILKSIKNVPKNQLRKEIKANISLYVNYLNKCSKRLKPEVTQKSDSNRPRENRSFRLIRKWEECGSLSHVEKKQKRLICCRVLQQELATDRRDFIQLITEFEEKSDAAGGDSAPHSWMTTARYLLESTLEFKAVTKIMTYYLSKLQIVAEDAIQNEEDVEALLDHLKQFLTVSYLRTNKPKTEVETCQPRRKDVVASLLSIFVDLFIYHNRDNKKKKVLRELTGFTFFLLGSDWSSTMDVLLQVVTPVHSSRLRSFARHCLEQVPVMIPDNSQYLKVMLCLKKFSDHIPDLVQDSLQRRAPLGFIDWLADKSPEAVGQIPDGIKFKGRQITHFLLTHTSDDLHSLLEDVLTDSDVITSLGLGQQEVETDNRIEANVGQANTTADDVGQLFVIDRKGQDKKKSEKKHETEGEEDMEVITEVTAVDQNGILTHSEGQTAVEVTDLSAVLSALHASEDKTANFTQISPSPKGKRKKTVFLDQQQPSSPMKIPKRNPNPVEEIVLDTGSSCDDVCEIVPDLSRLIKPQHNGFTVEQKEDSSTIEILDTEEEAATPTTKSAKNKPRSPKKSPSKALFKSPDRKKQKSLSSDDCIELKVTSPVPVKTLTKASLNSFSDDVIALESPERTKSTITSPIQKSGSELSDLSDSGTVIRLEISDSVFESESPHKSPRRVSPKKGVKTTSVKSIASPASSPSLFQASPLSVPLSSLRSSPEKSSSASPMSLRITTSSMSESNDETDTYITCKAVQRSGFKAKSASDVETKKSRSPHLQLRDVFSDEEIARGRRQKGTPVRKPVESRLADRDTSPKKVKSSQKMSVRSRLSSGEILPKSFDNKISGICVRSGESDHSNILQETYSKSQNISESANLASAQASPAGSKEGSSGSGHKFKKDDAGTVNRIESSDDSGDKRQVTRETPRRARKSVGSVRDSNAEATPSKRVKSSEDSSELSTPARKYSTRSTRSSSDDSEGKKRLQSTTPKRIAKSDKLAKDSDVEATPSKRASLAKSEKLVKDSDIEATPSKHALYAKLDKSVNDSNIEATPSEHATFAKSDKSLKDSDVESSPAIRATLTKSDKSTTDSDTEATSSKHAALAKLDKSNNETTPAKRTTRNKETPGQSTPGAGRYSTRSSRIDSPMIIRSGKKIGQPKTPKLSVVNEGDDEISFRTTPKLPKKKLSTPKSKVNFQLNQPNCFTTREHLKPHVKSYPKSLSNVMISDTELSFGSLSNTRADTGPADRFLEMISNCGESTYKGLPEKRMFSHLTSRSQLTQGEDGCENQLGDTASVSESCDSAEEDGSKTDKCADTDNRHLDISRFVSEDTDTDTDSQYGPIICSSSSPDSTDLEQGDSAPEIIILSDDDSGLNTTLRTGGDGPYKIHWKSLSSLVPDSAVITDDVPDVDEQYRNHWKSLSSLVPDSAVNTDDVPDVDEQCTIVRHASSCSDLLSKRIADACTGVLGQCVNVTGTSSTNSSGCNSTRNVNVLSGLGQWFDRGRLIAHADSPRNTFAEPRVFEQGTVTSACTSFCFDHRSTNAQQEVDGLCSHEKDSASNSGLAQITNSGIVCGICGSAGVACITEETSGSTAFQNDRFPSNVCVMPSCPDGTFRPVNDGNPRRSSHHSPSTQVNRMSSRLKSAYKTKCIQKNPSDCPTIGRQTSFYGHPALTRGKICSKGGRVNSGQKNNWEAESSGQCSCRDTTQHGPKMSSMRRCDNARSECSKTFTPWQGFSMELQQALNCSLDLAGLEDLEQTMVSSFGQPAADHRWREGSVKFCYNYLLLDPRLTRELTRKAETLGICEAFRTFVNAIFYVGKGKNSRLYSHLREAVSQLRRPKSEVNPNVDYILDIWRDGLGVVSLHCFQSTMPVEAYTREACLVEAIGLSHLANKNRGTFYGVASTWRPDMKRKMGVYLLKKAFQIFLIEGERQICLSDVKSSMTNRINCLA